MLILVNLLTLSTCAFIDNDHDLQFHSLYTMLYCLARRRRILIIYGSPIKILTSKPQEKQINTSKERGVITSRSTFNVKITAPAASTANATAKTSD